jgi:hypothetical protein
MKARPQFVETPFTRIVWQARHQLSYSTEAFFHDAFDYAHEDIKKGSDVVQKMFIDYLQSGGEKIPEPVIDFAIDVLSGRVNPFKDK